MSFSVVHTQTFSSTADTTTFLGYFFDTYLSGKTHWTVSAHPSGDADKRSIQLSLPTPMQAANHISYLWVSYNTSYLNWYDDATYTSTPGDLGTDTTNVRINASPFSSSSTSWRIWESGVDSNAWFVTKGKYVFLAWPGCSKSFGANDPSWDGSYDNNGTCLFPYTGAAPYTMYASNFPVASGTDGNEYSVIPSVYYRSERDLGLGPSLIHSFGWMTGFYSGGNAESTSTTILNAGPADVLWYTDFTSSSDTAREFLDNAWSLMHDATASKYYLLGTSDVAHQAIAFEMGSSEPSFT